VAAKNVRHYHAFGALLGYKNALVPLPADGVGAQRLVKRLQNAHNFAVFYSIKP